MSRVFVLQSTRRPADVSPAKAYGEIKYVLGPGDMSSCNPDLSLRKLTAILDGFDADHDYLLWSGGDPLTFFLAGAAMDNLGFDQFTYLRYERPETKTSSSSGYYVPVKVDLTVSERR